MNIFTLSKRGNVTKVGWAWPIMIVLAVTFVTAAPMCETVPADDPTIVQSAVTEAVALVDNMQQEVDGLKAKVASGQTLTPDEAAILARSEAQIAKLATALAEMQSKAHAAGRPVDAGDVAQGLTPMLGPIGIPLSLMIGGVSEWWRTRKKRKSFSVLVNAIDATKKKNAQFAEAMDVAGPQLHAELGPEARTVIAKMRATA